jgi:small subunit ribosomal protein S17
VKKRKKYLVHDETDSRMPGDLVRIEECRPISKRKTFTIVEIVKEAERFEHPVTKKLVTKASDL